MQRPRLLLMADVQESHERFLRRAVEHRSVWTLWGHCGPLIVESNFDPDDPDKEAGNDPLVAPRDVYLFFSDDAYARRVLRESWPDAPTYSTRSISLFDFLCWWLPGLHRDRHLAGTNWTGDLIGLEVEPEDLKAQLLDRCPRDFLVKFLDQIQAIRESEKNRQDG